MVRWVALKNEWSAHREVEMLYVYAVLWKHQNFVLAQGQVKTQNSLVQTKNLLVQKKAQVI